MNLESGNVLVLVGCVTALLLIAAPDGAEAKIKIGGYCRHLCAMARGGNLCKCSAVHFAGKRVGQSEGEESEVGDTGESFYSDLPAEGDSKVVQQEEESPRNPAAALGDVRKLYRQMKMMEQVSGGNNKLTDMIMARLEKLLALSDPEYPVRDS